MRSWVLALLVTACAGNLRARDPYAPASGGEINPGVVPDVRCAGAPETGKARGFRKTRHKIVATFAQPSHRGFDLIATTVQPQVLSGKLAYGMNLKTLDGEEVELFACIAGAWNRIGATRTDRSGKFALPLPAAERLPVGLRDVYASVVADRSGVRFLAYIAPPDAKLLVSDIDGTLTSSEASFIKAVLVGTRVKPHPGSAAVLRDARDRGYQVVYLTARGDLFTDATRHWLGRNGFPRGPVRLAPSIITVPGAATVAYKRRVLAALASFDIVAGVGNRETDVAAYSAAGIPAERIFVKLPEYKGELGTALRAGAAVGFGAYGPLALP